MSRRRMWVAGVVLVLAFGSATQATTVFLDESGIVDYQSNTTLTIDTTVAHNGTQSLKFSRAEAGWPGGGIKETESGPTNLGAFDPATGWLQFWYRTPDYTRGWTMEMAIWANEYGGFRKILSGPTDSAVTNDDQWHLMTVSNMVKHAEWTPDLDLNVDRAWYVRFQPTGPYGGFWGPHTVWVDEVQWVPEPSAALLLAAGSLLLRRRPGRA